MAEERLARPLDRGPGINGGEHRGAVEDRDQAAIRLGFAPMSTNGNRRPPRPRIEMLTPADPQEAAAVIAAVEQFLADTAPAPAAGAPPVNPWQRAALLEGVRSKEGFASPWGEPRTWGERHTHAPDRD